MNSVKTFDFVRPDICGPCGGRCCKGMPGAALPEDFGLPSTDRLVEALRSQQWAVDWWEGDPRPGRDGCDRAYFLRPATKGATRWPLDPSWGGACVFLGDGGCTLEHEARPAGCRALEPRWDGKCWSHAADKREAAVAWLPYRREVLAVVEVVRGDQK